MASTGLSHFSLRPWPTGDKKPKHLNEFVTRISVERGGFHNVPTEAEIREEAKIEEAQQQQLARLGGDDAMEDVSESEEGDDADATKLKSAWVARQEFLMNLDYAHNHAMLGLQFISLLLSKENPSQASGTLSPDLRDMVGIGTLGATKQKDSNMTEARIEDDLVVATGWRLMGINKMVRVVTDAAEKMEKEMALEAVYWNDMCQVRRAYRPFRLRRDPRILAVRFNLSESSPLFYDQFTGVLRRNDDGTAQLVTGPIGRGHKRFRTTIKTDGKITGVSYLRTRPADDAPILEQIGEAANTSNFQEIWHEINREARTLLSLGVSADESSVTWHMSPRIQVIFTLEELVNVEDEHTDKLPHDLAADMIMETISSLLRHAHEQNYKQRKRAQAPPSNRTNPYPVYPILRHMIAHERHMDGYKVLLSFLDQLVHLLRRAGVATAAYTRPRFVGFAGGRPPRAPSRNRLALLREFWANQVIYLMELVMNITLSPEASVQIRSVTHPIPYVAHRYAVLLPSSSSAGVQQQQNGVANGNTNQEQQQLQNQNQNQPQPSTLLEQFYPPSTDPYHNHLSVIEYVKNATTRALAAHLADSTRRRCIDEMRDDDDDSTGVITWAETMRGPAIVVDGRPEREVLVNIYYEADKDGDKGVRGEGEGKGIGGEGLLTRRLVLRLDARWIEKRIDGSLHPRTGIWVWGAYGGGSQGGHGETPEDVVFRVLVG